MRSLKVGNALIEVTHVFIHPFFNETVAEVIDQCDCRICRPLLKLLSIWKDLLGQILNSFQKVFRAYGKGEIFGHKLCFTQSQMYQLIWVFAFFQRFHFGFEFESALFRQGTGRRFIA